MNPHLVCEGTVKIGDPKRYHLPYLMRCNDYILEEEQGENTVIMYPESQRLSNDLQERQEMCEAYKNEFPDPNEENGEYFGMLLHYDNMKDGNDWFQHATDQDFATMTEDIKELVKAQYGDKVTIKMIVCHGGQLRHGEKHTIQQSGMHFHVVLNSPVKKPDNNFYQETLPCANGKWTGMRGNSMWIPDDDFVPQSLNPEHLTWKQIKEKFHIEGIPFRDGQADFSQIASTRITLQDGPLKTERDKNYSRAYELAAAIHGCTSTDVQKWMQDNKYTWHEECNCWEMTKVPTIVHQNVKHGGGVARAKKKQKVQNSVGIENNYCVVTKQNTQEGR